jgi:hypothetical protein
MKFIGCDLHKQSITICVVDQSRQVLERRRLACGDVRGIHAFFAQPVVLHLPELFGF